MTQSHSFTCSLAHPFTLSHSLYAQIQNVIQLNQLIHLKLMLMMWQTNFQIFVENCHCLQIYFAVYRREVDRISMSTWILYKCSCIPVFPVIWNAKYFLSVFSCSCVYFLLLCLVFVFFKGYTHFLFLLITESSLNYNFLYCFFLLLSFKCTIVIRIILMFLLIKSSFHNHFDVWNCKPSDIKLN